MTTYARTKVAACPHCDAWHDTAVVERHIAICARNPAVRPAILAIMEDEANPGFAASTATYRRRARGDRSVPSLETLMRTLGNWDAICQHFGLRPQSALPRTSKRKKSRMNAAAKARLEAKVLAEVAAAQADARQTERDWDDRGLEVCGRRVLPDGRVAWVLR